MSIEAKISRLAIASLILGMLFFVPLITAVMGIGTGLVARRAIRSSQGRLLGKGLATSGLVLSSFQGVIWTLILFAGMVFLVEPVETAVVARDNVPVRTRGPGVSFKFPFSESVVVYPAASIFEAQTKPVRTNFQSDESSNVIAKFGWKVCRPLQLYETSPRAFSKSNAAERLTILAERYLGSARHGAKNRHELVNAGEHPYKMAEAINSGAERFGLCVLYLSIEDAA